MKAELTLWFWGPICVLLSGSHPPLGNWLIFRFCYKWAHFPSRRCLPLGWAHLVFLTVLLGGKANLCRCGGRVVSTGSKRIRVKGVGSDSELKQKAGRLNKETWGKKPKGLLSFRCTNWGPSVQACEPRGDILIQTTPLPMLNVFLNLDIFYFFRSWIVG